MMQGYRDDAHCIEGFNLICIDVDDGKTSIEMVNLLLGKYQYMLYTTKRHEDNKPRFRIIMPTSHVLKLNINDYKDFMVNVFNWLPFKVDDGTGQRSKKWLSNPGKYIYNDGELLDVLPFIPKTKEEQKRKKIFNTTQSLNNLERFFIDNIEIGNRSNQLARYAFALVDSGLDQMEIRDKVMALNTKLPESLNTIEIDKTILVSVANKIAKKDSK